MKRPILLISYVFPPYPGIGGRRWAKHANELTKLGYDVHVICAENPHESESLWTDEVTHNPKIILHPLPSIFPKVLLKTGEGFWRKLQYYFWIKVLPVLVRGTIYDRAIFWRKMMISRAQKLIRTHGIRHVISTGGPFGSMYFAALLKRNSPNLFLLSDLRDPWTWGPNWGFRTLSHKRLTYEKLRERTVVEMSDVVTVPNGVMQKHLQLAYPRCAVKIIVLPHFYDPDELWQGPKSKSERIRLIYYGTIYQDIDRYLAQTADLMARYKDKFCLDLYTEDKQHIRYFENAGAVNVRTFDPLPAKELFQKVKDYDYVFILTPSYGKDNVSTKFYEIIYSRTPIILVSEFGHAAEFLVSNRLGIHVEPAEFEARMLQLCEMNTFKFNDEFDISQFSIKNVVNQIDDLFTQ